MKFKTFKNDRKKSKLPFPASFRILSVLVTGLRREPNVALYTRDLEIQ